MSDTLKPDGPESEFIGEDITVDDIFNIPDSIHETPVIQLTTVDGNTKFPKVRQVTYGFYGIGPNDCLSDTWYTFNPQRAFKPQGLMIWPTSSGTIQRVVCGNEDQLIGPVDFRGFESRESLDLIIDRYFDGNAAHKTAGVEYVFAQEMGDDPHGTFLYMPSLHIGLHLSIQFTGSLRGLLVIGVEPCDD